MFCSIKFRFTLRNSKKNFLVLFHSKIQNKNMSNVTQQEFEEYKEWAKAQLGRLEENLCKRQDDLTEMLRKDIQDSNARFESLVKQMTEASRLSSDRIQRQIRELADLESPAKLTRSPGMGDLLFGGDTKGPKGKTSHSDSSSEDEHSTGVERRPGKSSSWLKFTLTSFGGGVLQALIVLLYIRGKISLLMYY